MDREAWTLRQFNRKRKRFGEDVCNLIQIGTVSDGKQGHKLGETTLASNVECFVEELSEGSVEINHGTETVVATHRVTVPRSSQALSLLVTDRIQVLERDDNEEMIFEQPIRPKQSFAPLVQFRARLVKQGYRARA